MKKRVCIIGGGLSGLTTAYLLKDKFDVTLYEANHRFGGYIQTFRKNGYIVDVGPNTILNNDPLIIELLTKLGLADQIINTREDAKTKYIYTQKKLHLLPSNSKELLKSTLLPLSSKLKIFKELYFPSKYSEGDKKLSISRFLELHLGSFIANTIARSALTGIFAGDSKKLNIEKTMPKVLDATKTHGGLVKAWAKGTTVQSLNLKNGLETLTETLAKTIKDKYTGHEVLNIQKIADGYKINIQNSDINFDKEFDIVIVTTHGQKTFSWLESLDKNFKSKNLESIPYAPLRVIALGFKKKLSFKGFGVLIDPEENKNILGFLHPTDIFDCRAPVGKDTLIIMIGGIYKPELVKMSSERSLELAIEDLESILGELPELEFAQVVNHLPGLVQYENDALENLNFISEEVKKLPNFYLNSILSNGISVGDCIRKSFEIANKLNSQL